MSTEQTAGERLGPPEVQVLVADDNKDQADSLAALLRTWGYTVRVAYDGLTALETAQTYKPNVAILDLGLPVMDGYQLALQLRRQPELKDLKLIALTGYDWEGAQRRSQEYGFDRHCVKPVEPEELKHLLAEASRSPIAENPGNA